MAKIIISNLTFHVVVIKNEFSKRWNYKLKNSNLIFQKGKLRNLITKFNIPKWNKTFHKQVWSFSFYLSPLNSRILCTINLSKMVLKPLSTLKVSIPSKVQLISHLHIHTFLHPCSPTPQRNIQSIHSCGWNGYTNWHRYRNVRIWLHHAMTPSI